mgnify:CR=1 FL=1
MNELKASKSDIDIDKAQIVEVNGVKGRLIPLTKRGPQRRQIATPFADEEVVTVTLTGVYSAKGDTVALKIEGQHRGLQEPGPAQVLVTTNGKPVLTVNRDAITRKADRRSGIERRKAER